MVGREKKIVRHLNDEELDRLLTEADGIKVYKRLVFLKRLYGGATLAEAADDVGISEGTASNWVERWNEGGLGKLTPNFGGGRRPKLGQAERQELIERLREGQPWKKQEIQHLLDEEFNVDTTLTTCQRSLTTSVSRTLFRGRNGLIAPTTPRKSSTNAYSTRSSRILTTSHITSARVMTMMTTNTKTSGRSMKTSVLMAELSSDSSMSRTLNRGTTLSDCTRSMSHTSPGRW